MKNPTLAELRMALATGINLVPLDIFSDTLPVTQSLVGAYNSESWHPKPAGIQLPNPTA
jgi:hypothetical protein